MYKNKKHRKILLVSLVCFLLIMTVGYAAFYSQLQISGTSEVTSLWDVEITKIEKSQTNGNVSEIEDPTYTKDTATFNVGLEKPGDYIYYKIEVTNKGTVAAMATLGNLSCGNSDAIECGAYPDSSISTSIQGNQDLTSSRLIIGPNEKEYYNVWVSYRSDITTQPEITNTNITLELTYKQSDVGITHKTEDNCYTSKVLENGTLEITDYNESCGTDVVIPETINGYTVTEIADGRYDYNTSSFTSAFAHKNITNVTIPNTITYIGYATFYDNNITSLIVPSNVKSIDSYAFTYNNINNLVLNEGITKLGAWVFQFNNLHDIKLPSTINTIGIGAFSNNHLTEINIPSTVTNLSGAAFNLNDVEGEAAYIYARNRDGSIDYSKIVSYAGQKIDNFELPTTVTTIDDYAFHYIDMTGLSLKIPNNVTYIGVNSFKNCRLDSVTLNNNLKEIGEGAFKSNNLKELTIPDSVETIGKEAFESNRLQIVTIGSGIKAIGENAFQSINGLNPITSITINKAPNTVSGYPWGATNAKIDWIA